MNGNFTKNYRYFKKSTTGYLNQLRQAFKFLAVSFPQTRPQATPDKNYRNECLIDLDSLKAVPDYVDFVGVETMVFTKN